MRSRIFRLVGNLFDNLIRNERRAARLRLLFAISLILTLTTFGYQLFEDINPFAMAYVAWEHSWLRTFFFLVPVYIPISFTWIVIRFSFRHAIIPVALVVAALLSSASYIQDIYELPSIRPALRYIIAAFFGIRYPRLRIERGEMKVPDGEVNLLKIIGGPGWINVRPGSVVLFESLRSPSRVVGAGLHFVSRFDTIREIISLEDQHGFIEATTATTKDGIEVVVQGVHYRYRLRTGRQFSDYAERTLTDPYPFSVQAVKDLAYNRSVRANGPTSWDDAVKLAVDSGITDYIKDHTFDHVTAPMAREGDPRQAINTDMMRKGIRQRLRTIGTELVWFDIGHFGVSDRTVVSAEISDEPRPLRQNEVVEAHRIGTWGAKWLGDADIVRSQGEARRQAVQELGRAEGQADMLQSIIRALEEAEQEGVPLRPEQIRAVLLARTAQVLDAMAEKERKRRARDRLTPGSDPEA